MPPSFVARYHGLPGVLPAKLTRSAVTAGSLSTLAWRCLDIFFQTASFFRSATRFSGVRVLIVFCRAPTMAVLRAADNLLISPPLLATSVAASPAPAPCDVQLPPVALPMQ